MGNYKTKEQRRNTPQNSVLNMNFNMKSKGEPIVNMHTIRQKLKNSENTMKTTMNSENNVTPEKNATQNGTIHDHDHPDLIQKAEQDPFFEVPIDDGENIYIRKEKYLQSSKKKSKTINILKMVMTTFIGVAMGATLTLSYSHLVYKCEGKNLTQPDLHPTPALSTLTSSPHTSPTQPSPPLPIPAITADPGTSPTTVYTGLPPILSTITQDSSLHAPPDDSTLSQPNHEQSDWIHFFTKKEPIHGTNTNLHNTTEEPVSLPAPINEPVSLPTPTQSQSQHPPDTTQSLPPLTTHLTQPSPTLLSQTPSPTLLSQTSPPPVPTTTTTERFNLINPYFDW